MRPGRCRTREKKAADRPVDLWTMPAAPGCSVASLPPPWTTPVDGLRRPQGCPPHQPFAHKIHRPHNLPVFLARQRKLPTHRWMYGERKSKIAK